MQSLAERVAAMNHSEREVFLMGLTADEADDLIWDWDFWARPEQMAPPGDWNTWLMLAGRGFGKTRAGAGWVGKCVYPKGSTPLSAPGGVGRIALVAETAADARDVMVRGPGGLIATAPPEFRPRYIESQRRLEWPNGAVALTFSAEDPEQLRGPEHEIAWSDELAKWRYAQQTWDMLQFGLRVGARPRQLVTTTPRPIPIVRKLLERSIPSHLAGHSSADVVVTRGSTFDNAANLPSSFLQQIRDRYEGTRLGRQELNAELLDDVPGALWTRQMLETRSSWAPKGATMSREERLPEMRRLVVAVDPSGSSGEDEDESDDIGIVVAGKGDDGIYYILEDATLAAGPNGWGRRAVYMYEKYRADLIVGEKNFGGAMVEFTIRTVKRNVNYRSVTASRGKVVRAEPIAALYEQGKVRHVGTMAALEDQMCSMTGGGYLGKGSPDRVDALVWALTELAFGASNRGGTGALKGLG